jgi:hypothetical protein
MEFGTQFEVVGSFCRNWIFSMLITEIPQYMDDSFKIGIFEVSF